MFALCCVLTRYSFPPCFPFSPFASFLQCVVAYADQWYLKYGEPEWQAQIRSHVEKKLETYNPQAKKEFLTTIDWLHEWAASRGAGLGTRVPWDKQYVIESLSDSTIYMAYYTISHLLQGGALNGSLVGSAGIKADQLTDEVFNYIFLHDIFPSPPSTDIPLTTLDQLKSEFRFWYPMDLRVSGKDLIGNHLTMSLYNHAAIWDVPDGGEKYWPQSFFTNGHAMLNGAKMSKSTGNFITLEGSCVKYSADATRFVLADAGDGLEDANFEEKNANAAILKLTKELDWIEETILPKLSSYRTGDYEFADRVFENEMNAAIAAADAAYAAILYRDALQASFRSLQAARDRYRLNTKSFHQTLIQRYLEISSILISPICPHYAQELWELCGLNKSKNIPFVLSASWPAVGKVDLILSRQVKYLDEVNSMTKRSYAEAVQRVTKTKVKDKSAKQVAASGAELIDSLIIYVANEYPAYQQKVLILVRSMYESVTPNVIPDRKVVIPALKSEFGSDKKLFESATKFATTVLEELRDRGVSALELSTPFDEVKLIREQIAVVGSDVPVELSAIEVRAASTGVEETEVLQKTTAARALPGRPATYFFKKSS